MASSLLECLAQPPLSLTRKDLRECLCAIGGDGEMVRGGADRAKPGTQAAELMWFQVFPAAAPGAAGVLADLAEQGRPRGGQGPRGDWVADGSTLHACTEWDKFHREDSR